MTPSNACYRCSPTGDVRLTGARRASDKADGPAKTRAAAARRLAGAAAGRSPLAAGPRREEVGGGPMTSSVSAVAEARRPVQAGSRRQRCACVARQSACLLLVACRARGRLARRPVCVALGCPRRATSRCVSFSKVPPLTHHPRTASDGCGAFARERHTGRQRRQPRSPHAACHRHHHADQSQGTRRRQAGEAVVFVELTCLGRWVAGAVVVDRPSRARR